MNFLPHDGVPAGTLVIDNTTDVITLQAGLNDTLSLALQFPKWTDGRAYSQARLLRSRLHFTGELLATGDVLVDMLPLLQRCGFSSVLLRADQDVEDARRAMGFFDGHYQAELISKLPRHTAQPRALPR